MKTVLFCRVSSKDQEETGYSLPAQEKLLKTYALKKELTVARVFSVSESASGRSQRATFIEMMSYVQKENIDVIVCEKVDRLTRNLKDSVMIDEWLDKDEKRQVHLVKDSLIMHKNSRSQEKLNWGIRLLFAKNFIDNLSEEVKKGQKEKLQQGWLPARAPVGYKTFGESGHKIHVIDDVKAPLVRKAFELYATGAYSLSRLTDTITTDGLTGVTDKPIKRSRVALLLQDPFYIGQLKWNDKVYQGQHAHLITRELYDKVQNVLHGKGTPKYSKHEYLFKGFIRCQECGGVISWEKQKGHVYGHCNHYRQCSQTVWSKEPEVEAQLLPVFDSLVIKNKRIMEWVRKALKDSMYDEADYSEASKQELMRKDAALNKRLQKMYVDLLDERITQGFYDKLKLDAEKELVGIADKLKAYNSANIKNVDAGVDLYMLAQNARVSYLDRNLEGRRRLIKLVFNTLTLDKGKLGYELHTPFKLIREMAKIVESSKQVFETAEAMKIFEPTEKVAMKTQKEFLELNCPSLLGDMDSNHDKQIQSLLSYR